MGRVFTLFGQSGAAVDGTDNSLGAFNEGRLLRGIVPGVQSHTNAGANALLAECARRASHVRAETESHAIGRPRRASANGNPGQDLEIGDPIAGGKIVDVKRALLPSGVDGQFKNTAVDRARLKFGEYLATWEMGATRSVRFLIRDFSE